MKQVGIAQPHRTSEKTQAQIRVLEVEVQMLQKSPTPASCVTGGLREKKRNSEGITRRATTNNTKKLLLGVITLLE